MDLQPKVATANDSEAGMEISPADWGHRSAPGTEGSVIRLWRGDRDNYSLTCDGFTSCQDTVLHSLWHPNSLTAGVFLLAVPMARGGVVKAVPWLPGLTLSWVVLECLSRWALHCLVDVQGCE